MERKYTYEQRNAVNVFGEEYAPGQQLPQFHVPDAFLVFEGMEQSLYRCSACAMSCNVHISQRHFVCPRCQTVNKTKSVPPMMQQNNFLAPQQQQQQQQNLFLPPPPEYDADVGFVRPEPEQPPAIQNSIQLTQGGFQQQQQPIIQVVNVTVNQAPPSMQQQPIMNEYTAPPQHPVMGGGGNGNHSRQRIAQMREMEMNRREELELLQENDVFDFNHQQLDSATLDIIEHTSGEHRRYLTENIRFPEGRDALCVRGCCCSQIILINFIYTCFIMCQNRTLLKRRQRYQIDWYDTRLAKKGFVIGWIIFLIWFPLYLGYLFGWVSVMQIWATCVAFACGLCCVVCCWDIDCWTRTNENSSGSGYCYYYGDTSSSSSSSSGGGGDGTGYGGTCECCRCDGGCDNVCGCINCSSCEGIGVQCDLVCSSVFDGLGNCFMAFYESSAGVCGEVWSGPCGDALNGISTGCDQIGDSCAGCFEGDCNLDCDCGGIGDSCGNLDCGGCDCDCGGCDC